MRREPPVCVAGPKWVRARLRNPSALAPLTGQDARALASFLHLLDLYVVADNAGRTSALEAMRATLRAMQPSCRAIAKACIPHVLDWGDEDRLWPHVVPA